MTQLSLIKSKKTFLILIFFIIFTYYLNYPSESSKAFLLELGVDKQMHIKYGLWGLLNDYLYQFLEFFFGSMINGFVIVELIIVQLPFL